MLVLGVWAFDEVVWPPCGWSRELPWWRGLWLLAVSNSVDERAAKLDGKINAHGMDE